MTSNPEFRLLADVNISPLTVESLRSAGWNAVRVTDDLPPDTPDAEILRFARQQERIIITQDLDFSDLLALGGHTHPSLITVRVSDPAPQIVSDRLLSVLPHIQEDLRTGAAVTVDDESIRVRLLPIS